MSSGIVMMNKMGIALAADSAVTIGNRLAIFNNAQKIFRLGETAVAVVIYSAATVMQVPIEVLMKEFSKHIGNKIQKNTLSEYLGEFLIFLTSEYKYFMFHRNEKDLMISFITDIIERIFYEVDFQDSKHLDKIESNSQKLKELANAEGYRDVENAPLFSTVTSAYPDIVQEAYTDYFSYKLKRDFKLYPLEEDDFKVIKNIQEIASISTGMSLYYKNETGMCFTGYGLNEIYPSYVHIGLLGIFNGRPFYVSKGDRNISNESTYSVLPLAQQDVIQSIVQGYNNQILSIIYDQMEEQTLSFLESKLRKISDKLFSYESFIEDYRVFSRKLRGEDDPRLYEFRSKILDSVAVLPIQDMANLAEDLINVQSTKRRYDNDSEYNATVGGPIDVGIITKSLGFVWIKNSK
jgi:hypothetical protein